MIELKEEINNLIEIYGAQVANKNGLLNSLETLSKQWAIERVEEVEIRDDSSGEYVTDDTELMRNEIIETFKELQ